MSDHQLAPCWEFQPYLAEKNVRQLLAEIANVLEQLYYHKHTLDSNWSEGVRAYDWVRNHLIQSEGTIPGLEMVSKGLDYVVALNKVPLQFSKDCINNPKKRHRLLRNKVECEQLSLFGDVEAEQDITWRILAEPFISVEEDGELESTLPRWEVALVGFNAYGAQISMISHQSTASVPLMPLDSNSFPDEAEIGKAHLRRRNKDQDLDVNSNGTSGD
ncbi:hypothetical protein N5C39_09530 [Enterobacter bugandensis]|uniref:Uncharacterized protein n=1 Tax=Enterobacter bugandensis TaxID=881260 RepID=A0AA42PQ47_9ENTR|nr:hypothetical protein [Enterobacter bugandensis]MDH1318606.1 hypothetical protein [Enterobacter bugandensis]